MLLSGVAVKVVGVVLAAGAVGGGAVLANGPVGERAEVVRVVDGDTFVARLGDREESVRLLNVDTPETRHPDRGVECLGPEARAFLARTLTPGSTVTLTYDEERRDGYGRLLAGVETEDAVFVNAAIAANGLGVPKVYEPNRRYYDEVRAAQDDARRRGVGLYSPAVECTVPGRVAATEVAPASPTTAAAMDAEADGMAALATTASSVRAWFDLPRVGLVWEAFDRGTQEVFRARTDGNLTEARAAGKRLRAAAGDLRAEQARAAEAARVAERARVDAERRARVEAERRARAEAAEQRRVDAAAQAERRRAAQAAARATVADASSDDSGDSSGSSRGASSSGGPAGYTGPRCYAPGGKTWRPC